jgi:superfamily I DNA/RNA helicase
MKRFGVPFSNKYKLDDNRWNPIDAKTLKIINAVKNTQNREDVFLWLKYIKKDLLKRKIVKPTDIEKETFYRSYLEDNLIQVEFDKFEELELKDKMSWFMKSIDHKYIKKFEYAEKVTTGPYKDLKEITVSTVHGVKGREAECVFICPDKSPAMEKSSIFDKSDIIRQFYVAMTRSSCKVYFCTPTKAGIKFKV